VISGIMTRGSGGKVTMSLNRKKAAITGSTGQDSPYSAELLLAKGTRAWKEAIQ
jgi:hypothetical protein